MSQPNSLTRTILNNSFRCGCLVLLAISLNACTTVRIDESRTGQSAIQSYEKIVILGRRHASDYETEPDLISCIGKLVASGADKIQVVEEKDFLDEFYPWFEPRYAPMKPRDLNRFLNRKEIVDTMAKEGVRYMVWVDGNTETTDSAGSIGCSIAAGGAACFGFGTWDKESDYEAQIWDYQTRKELGKISVDASGTSYMPAIILPIPIIARVQANACKGIGTQLQTFFTGSQEEN